MISPLVILAADATTWQTPAWALVMILLGGVLSAIVALIFYLVRRADKAEQEEEDQWRTAMIDRVDALLASIQHANVAVEKLSDRFDRFHDDSVESNLLTERRLARIEGHIFGARAGEVDEQVIQGGRK